MPINETELTQLKQDTRDELVLVSTRRNELKELNRKITSIEMTSRTEITPAVAAVPVVMDGSTIITPAVAASEEKTEQVFDVQPIDINLNTSMTDERRQEIYDVAVAKKASLGY